MITVRDAGWAIARGRPAFVNLHTTAGLANAAGALATARTNRVPLVVVVGQQDRRHLAYDPFLAGRLQGLLGVYPVWTDHPARPQDVPEAIARAHHEAITGAGRRAAPATILDAALSYVDAVCHEADLGPKLRELAILTVAHASCVEYEVSHHSAHAVRPSNWPTWRTSRSPRHSTRWNAP